MLLLKLKQHYLDTEVADSIETDQLPTTKIVKFEYIKKIELLEKSNSSITTANGPNFKGKTIEGLSTSTAKILQKF